MGSDMGLGRAHDSAGAAGRPTGRPRRAARIAAFSEGASLPILGRILRDRGVITDRQLQEAIQHQVLYGGRLGTSLYELGFITEERLTDALARAHGVPAIDLKAISPEAVGARPEEARPALQGVPVPAARPDAVPRDGRSRATTPPSPRSATRSATSCARWWCPSSGWCSCSTTTTASTSAGGSPTRTAPAPEVPADPRPRGGRRAHRRAATRDEVVAARARARALLLPARGVLHRARAVGAGLGRRRRGNGPRARRGAAHPARPAVGVPERDPQPHDVRRPARGPRRRTRPSWRRSARSRAPRPPCSRSRSRAAS